MFKMHFKDHSVTWYFNCLFTVNGGTIVESFFSCQPEKWHWQLVCPDKTDLNGKGRCKNVVHQLNLRRDLFMELNGEVNFQGCPWREIDKILKDTTESKTRFNDPLVKYTWIGPSMLQLKTSSSNLCITHY